MPRDPARLQIRRPDDWHLHLRDGAMLRAVLPHSAAWAGRAVVMPNLVPPVVTAADALAYRERILAALPPGARFRPLMTLYLTEGTAAADVARAHRHGVAHAVKLYPAGATTNSHAGVRDLDRVRPVLERMAEIGMPLLVHGEVTDPSVDIFDREAVFIDRVLAPLRRRNPDLRIVLEHVTTLDAVEFVRDASRNLAATVTAHHLVINRNAMLAGGIRPHMYCLPVAKRERHRVALVRRRPRATRASSSAPTRRRTSTRPSSSPAAARASSPPRDAAVLAEVFERRGPARRAAKLRLAQRPALLRPAPQRGPRDAGPRRPWAPPPAIDTEDGPVTVFDPGFPLRWRLELTRRSSDLRPRPASPP
jgi:dihydroorotase